jgi:hypothetical protein
MSYENVYRLEICPNDEAAEYFQETWHERIHCKLAEEGIDFNSYDVKMLTVEEFNKIIQKPAFKTLTIEQKDNYRAAVKNGKLLYIEIEY